MKTLRPLFLIVSLILMVGLACAFGGTKATPTSAPEPTTAVEDQPTDEPTEASADTPTDEPTQETSSDATPTNTPKTDAVAYYTEEFDGNLDNYTYVNEGKGDEKKMSLKTLDGALVFDLKGTNLWIYVTYNAFTYKDVAVEVVADNRGKNTNNISLLCRYSKDEGWYEFNISNGGLYWIYAYDVTGAVRKGYNAITNGASKLVKQGKGVNTYSASCIGNELTLSINGTEVKTITDNKFDFSEGKVGFSVSSFDVTPILVNVDSFTISEP